MSAAVELILGLLDRIIPFSFKRKKTYLLVVEDNTDDIFIIKEYIEQTGNLCHIEKTAEGALGRLRESDYKIVFVDCRLPYDSGVSLANHISVEFPKVNIVITPGLIEDLKGLHPGLFLSIIYKPLSPSSIQTAIDKLGLKK